MKTQSRVQSILSMPVKKVDRVKASFNLDKALFDGFKAVCEAREITQSELLEAMLEDLQAQAKRHALDS